MMFRWKLSVVDVVVIVVDVVVIVVDVVVIVDVVCL